ncbi:hypothetical protein BC936DRAFT_137731 [Jimgerdemannia flammicorona]|uniref:Phosphatidic acid phosphatase type 2/haloperoxidase domain-containing protein n=1 Tax=Jimgerdemannia flammicorona TaxID=994334 RepID=A0A433CWS9_9FUNG|nr:hypothetical protein BC936DRAFT_137731 [Jimgerdemannia flammicorona]
MAASTSSQQPSAPAFSLLNARRPSETFERGSFDNNIDDYREEPTAFSFIAPYENLNWWEKSYIVDWLVGIVLLALGSIIQNIPPPERDFDAKDLDISHPKRGSSVPGSLLWFLATVIPIGVFVLYNFFDTIGKCIYTRERIERNKLFGLRTHDLHNACLGWFVSITLTKVITNTFKVAVGRMRPDFLDRCKLSLITQYCTGDESAIIDGRKSFPSDGIRRFHVPRSLSRD